MLVDVLKRVVLDAATGDMDCPDNYGLDPGVFGCTREASSMCYTCWAAAIEHAEKGEKD